MKDMTAHVWKRHRLEDITNLLLSSRTKRQKVHSRVLYIYPPYTLDSDLLSFLLNVTIAHAIYGRARKLRPPGKCYLLPLHGVSSEKQTNCYYVVSRKRAIIISSADPPHTHTRNYSESPLLPPSHVLNDYQRGWIVI